MPPVRGGGNQGFHTGCHWAVMAILVALLHREETGEGQQSSILQSFGHPKSTNRSRRSVPLRQRHERR